MNNFKKSYHNQYAVRADFLYFFLKIIPSVAILFILLFLFIGAYNSAIVTSIFLTLTLLISTFKKHQFSFEASLVLAIAFILEPIGAICLSNGLESPYIVWLIVPIYAASSLLGNRGTLIAACMAIVFFVLIAVFQEQLLVINELKPKYYSAVYVLSFVSAAALMGVFAWRNIFKIESYALSQKRLREVVEKNNTNLRAKEKEQQKLLAIVSHELRTPASILNMTLEQDDAAIDISLLRRTTSHLMDVLQDMRMVKEPEVLLNTPIKKTNIKVLLQEALELVASYTDSKNLEITIHESKDLRYDCLVKGKLVKQIAMNIIKNCVNHAEASRLEITLKSQEVENAIVYRITFSDDGVGIPAEKVQSIFNPFTKVDANTTGSGLGLHLSKEFAIKGLSGDLKYVDTGIGATFILEVTAEKCMNRLENEANKTKNSKNIGLEGKTILLAEDNQVINLLTKKMLENYGANVLTALNGKIALDMFNKNKIDIVLTDIFMPEINGYELTKKLRAFDFKGPIIGCTAATLGQEVHQILAAGADKAFTKPLKIEELLTYLNKNNHLNNNNKVFYLNGYSDVDKEKLSQNS